MEKGHLFYPEPARRRGRLGPKTVGTGTPCPTVDEVREALGYQGQRQSTPSVQGLLLLFHEVFPE